VSAADLELADVFERGEIGAFEYPDGHTYPPHREVVRQRRRLGMTNVVDTDPREAADAVRLSWDDVDDDECDE
jgi:hypothetical protein